MKVYDFYTGQLIGDTDKMYQQPNYKVEIPNEEELKKIKEINDGLSRVFKKLIKNMVDAGLYDRVFSDGEVKLVLQKGKKENEFILVVQGRV